MREETLQGTVLNGRYRLGDTIGEGGMSVVYRAQDQLLNRSVAVKILRAQYAADDSFLKRFEREAQAAAGLSHPNIVNVYDVGTDQGLHYIVMEYIRGPSLKELIRRQGPFSVDGAVFVISQVASALDYAHQRGLIHRDIKPQNILVDRDGNAKVVDFGIAKGMRDVNLTEAGTGMGTVHYVSPEQARGEAATPASDLYSTGVVLFEMLTKRMPFEADTPVGVAMQHVNNSPPPPRSLNPDIPPQVEAIVLRALAKDPRDRFPSGAALASALRHWDTALPLRSDTGQMTQTVVVPRATAAPPQRVPATRAAAAPPRARRREDMRAAPPPPPPRDSAFRDDVGCVTWLLGSAILLGIVGLVVIAFRLGPDLFEEDPPVNPTATQQSVAEPTAGATEPAPTATLEPTPTLPAPTATTAPTATVGPTATPSAGPVPALVGSTLDQAQAAVGDQWQLTSEQAFSDDVPAGQIISQDPESGATLPFGETISVVVSNGPETVAIPDVRGVPLAQARQQLESLGFVVTTSEEPSQEVAEGQVIRTEPQGEAPPGSTVNVVVSVGDTVTVPDVTQADVDEAVEALTAVGLAPNEPIALDCETIQSQDASFDCDEFPDEGVYFTDPLAGAEVERGSAIDIVYYDDDL